MHNINHFHKDKSNCNGVISSLSHLFLSLSVLFFTVAVFIFIFIYSKENHVKAYFSYFDCSRNEMVYSEEDKVNYILNDKPINTIFGIVSDEVNMCDLDELFESCIGLSVSKLGSSGTFTITDGLTSLEMNVGDKYALLNGEQFILDKAPMEIILENDDTRKFFVPVKSICECFGYDYSWVSTSSTCKITRYYDLKITNHNITYNTAIYGASYHNENIEFGALPIISYRGALIVRAKKLFETLGCSYSQSETKLILKKGNISINLTLDSDIAYVNGRKIIMDAPATLITNRKTNVSYAVVPIEFCLDALGFLYTYDIDLKEYVISENENTGIFESNNFLKALSSDINTGGNSNVNVAENELFSFSMRSEYETILENARITGSGKAYLTEVAGYTLTNSDAIVLFGIDSSDVSLYLDGNMLLISLTGAANLCGEELYMTEGNKYLNYCLLSGDMNTTILVTYVEPGQVFYIYDRSEDYVSIHITSEEIMVRDEGYSLVERSEPTPEPQPGDGFETPLEELPDDRLIIPLPESTKLSEITDIDNYLNYNFVIQLPGDCTDFIRDNGIKNPYSIVEGYSLRYNDKSHYTSISFDTKLIVAYEYTIINNYLCVKVARPNEIYDKIVLLDPGHGGYDPGASKSGINEKDINFKICKDLCKEYFKGSGIKVYFTRETDVLISLEDRAVFADEVCADIFISLHMNSNDSSQPNGCEVFYSKSNNRMQPNGLMSSDIAEILVADLSEKLGFKNRGISDAAFYVIKYNKVPAVLIELGFMSNNDDFKKLTDESYQRKAAEVIRDSCIKLFGLYPTGR